MAPTPAEDIAEQLADATAPLAKTAVLLRYGWTVREIAGYFRIPVGSV
jgi:DNA-directed RNA polymerase specialized sigma24 family protein